MSKQSSAVAVTDTAELAAEAQAKLEDELAAGNRSEADASDIQIPLLKIGQPLTDEVVEGDARSGEFINALTREGLGDKVDFVVAGFQKGRFDHGVRGESKSRKAYGVKTVPWNDDPFYGQPWSVHPDAEEGYAKRVNAGEIQWGKGPRISTTFDFTGFIVPEKGFEGDPMPMCLSLMRMNTKQAKKWFTILEAVLRGRYWNSVFTLSTVQQRNDSGNYYTINVKQARNTSAEEKQAAVSLALLLKQRAADVQIVGDEDEKKAAVEPDAAGGMEV